MMLRQGQLCTAMSELVGEFAGYDLYVDPTHDALSEEGLQILLSLVLRVAAGGLILKDCTSCHIWMSAFGSDSPKPLMLKGSASQILETIGEVSKQRRRKCPLQTRLAKASVDSRGVKRFTGKRSLLQASSAYTREMGLAMAYAHLGFNPSQIMSMLGE